MTSTLTLYYKSLLNKDKNFILDNPDGSKAIDTYLATLTSTAISNFQYIKHAVTLKIKVDMPQSALEMPASAKDLNYCKIQNQGEKALYYFIVDKKWTSQNTIALTLNMDTLNSFRFNNDYSVSDKTLVQRMHKDRFSAKDNRYITITGTIYINTILPTLEMKYLLLANSLTFTGYLIDYNYDTNTYVFLITDGDPGQLQQAIAQGGDSVEISEYDTPANYLILDVTDDDVLCGYIKKIDLKSENISAPLYKESEENLYEQKGESNIDWVLYYKTADNQESTPIDCYLLPSEPLNITYQNNSGEINSLNIPLGKYILFVSTYASGPLSFNCNGNIYSTSHPDFDFWHTDVYNVVAILNDSGNIKVYTNSIYQSRFIQGLWLESGWVNVYSPTGSDPLPFVVNSPSSIFGHEMNSLPTPTQFASGGGLWLPAYGTYEVSMGAKTNATLLSVVDIDNTLETNVKIINIPYSPTSYSVESGVYNFDSCWTYSSASKQIKLVDFTTRFVNHIDSQARNVLHNYVYLSKGWNNTSTRYMKDSKLSHSDYYRPKFVYDAFSKVFPLEEINFDYNTEIFKSYFSFDFIMSRNIVSKFLFMFDFKYNHAMEDYENIVAVSRNNEEVLYNSQYLNYIRTGYNYDLKAKEKQEVTAGVGIGLNVAGFLASLGIGVATQNPVALGSAVATGISLVSQLVNYAKTISQNEDNIQRKLVEGQHQAVSVLNADDYDLLYAYSGNKAKLCYYKISSQMEQVLDDLFYYGGYVINEQMIPVINSRYWFNFVQCTLVINDTDNLTEEVENDLKDKFNNGVTFLHYRNSTFDFAQEKENLEVSLM